MPDLGIDAQIKAAIRELGFRERVYPGWVTKGKMKQVEADLQIALMRAILETLKKVQMAGPISCGGGL